ncbi:MAG: phosphohistidine phosphatase SixA [Phycisphaerales bacterium]|nr:phosphohistidine phosphatase SixA [Phycisphaerales bacterium]
MIVYLIRHGQAENQSESGRDSDRILTHLGHRQAQAIAMFLTDPKSNPPIRVLASPYTRTQQTASAIWNAMDHPNQSEERLAAHKSVPDILDVIADTPVSVLAIISHNPIISRTADVLTAGPSAGHLYSMRPGQLIALKIDQSNPLGSAQLIAQFRLDD